MTPAQQSAFLFLLGVQVLAIGLLTCVVVIVITLSNRQLRSVHNERFVMDTVEKIDLALDAIRDTIALVAKRQENLLATIKNLQDQLAGGVPVNQGQLDNLLDEANQALAMLTPLAGGDAPPAPVVTPSTPAPEGDHPGSGGKSLETPEGGDGEVATPPSEVPPPAVTPSEPSDAPATPPPA